MRKLQFFILSAVLVSIITGVQFHCNGQDVLITKRDSTQIETRIKTRTSSAIVTSDGNFLMKDLAIVTFKYRSAEDEQLYKILVDAGAAVRFGYAASSPLFQKGSEPIHIATDASMEKFRKTRTAAKVLELVGALALSASMIMNTVASDQLQKDIKSGAYSQPNYSAPSVMPAAVPIAGGILLSVGFVFDIKAGSHLRRK